MQLTCLAVDDEPMARALIEKYVQQTPFLELAGSFGSAFEVLEFLNKGDHADLIFLDIQMPDLNGMQLSKLLPEHIKIVFTTAFDNYAIEGYQVNAIGYLLKPFDYNEFLTVAIRVKERIGDNIKPSVEKEGNYLFVRSEYKQIKINYDDILYIEGLKDYVKIYTTKYEKPVLSLLSLKKLEAFLPGKLFMRVHRSFIISLDKINAVEKSYILINEREITVAQQYKEILAEFIRKKSI